MDRRRRHRVGVTGTGIVCAVGSSSAEFLEAIVASRSGARPAPELTAPVRQARVAACIPVSSEESRSDSRDRAFGMALDACMEATRQAGLEARDFPPGSGLVLGTCLGGALKAQSWHSAFLRGERRRRSDLLHAPLHAVGDHVARRLGLDGPRTVISNACVSSANALGLALEMIRAGETELVVAGGVDTLHGFNFSGFSLLGALTNDRCRPFDASREGMLLGEAAAFLIVESEVSAKRRGRACLAELAGYGSSCDAVHVTAPDRTGSGAARAISAALDDAGTTPDEVDFIALHGVGTRFADSMEAAAMGRIFGDRLTDVPAASLRPMTGHSMGSVGAVDCIACVLAIEEGLIPATKHHRALDPQLPAPLRILREPLHTPVGVALNTTSGFGGANAALVFRRWETSV